MADVVSSSNNSWDAWNQMASIVNSCYTNNDSNSEVVIQVFEEKVKKPAYALSQNTATTPEELFGQITSERLEKDVDGLLNESLKTRVWTAFESLGGALLSLALIVCFVVIVVIWFMVEGAIITSWLPTALVLGVFFTVLIVPLIFFVEILSTFLHHIIDLFDRIEEICKESDAYDATKVELEMIKSELIPLEKYKAIEDLFQPVINYVQSDPYTKSRFSDWIKNPNSLNNIHYNYRQYFEGAFSSFKIAKGLFAGELLPEIFHKISNLYMYLKIFDQNLEHHRDMQNPLNPSRCQLRDNLMGELSKKLYHASENKLHTLPEEGQKEYQNRYQHNWQQMHGGYRPALPFVDTENAGTYDSYLESVERGEYLQELKETFSMVLESENGKQDLEFPGENRINVADSDDESSD